ncbi:MAG: hypothetical protein U5K81_10570 [Trueperaceae bacterium]|nr:hypothetical protein [Trueperaceae bacterium]
MSRALARIAALERQACRETGVTVWNQDPTGADTFTSSKHPGEALVRAQLADRPGPTDALRIVVEYVTATPRD